MSHALAQSVEFAPRQLSVFSGTAKFPFEIRVLHRDADKSDVFALRHRAYVASGIKMTEGATLFSDDIDGSPHCIIMLAYDGARCVGTVRANFSHPWQPVSTLACAPYFPALDDVKASASGALIEVGRMAIEPGISNTSYRTTLYAALVRAGYLTALASNASHVLVTTKSEWVGFYTKMLGFKPIGEPALYPPGDIPITLLVGTMTTAERMQKAQNAFFRIASDEVASMRKAIQRTLIS